MLFEPSNIEAFDAVHVIVPVLAIGLTIGVFLTACRIQRALYGACILHPVLVSVTIGVLVLLLSGVPYDDYFAEAYALHFLLGPMTALLAVPLIRQATLIRRSVRPLCLGLLIGSIAALITTASLVAAFAGPEELMATALPKSTTTAIAISLSESIGGAPGLTALIVILTGIFGAAFGPVLLRAAKISDERAIGLALGVSAHVIGTARAFQVSETAGAFATMGTILNGLATSTIICAFAAYMT